MNSHYYRLCSILFICLSFPSITFSLNSDCKPQITYQSSSGNYIDILGLKNLELERILDKLATKDANYCNMHITIRFKKGLQSKQLVHKNIKANSHHFKIEYQAPVYSVTIKNTAGTLLHDLTFGEEPAYYTFPDQYSLNSKQSLYKLWDEQRNTVYKELEAKSNNYQDLKDFLNALDPSEDLATKEDKQANQTQEKEPEFVLDPEPAITTNQVPDISAPIEIPTPQPEPQAEPEPQIKLETEPEPQVEPESHPLAKAEPEVEIKLAPQSRTEVKIAAEPEPAKENNQQKVIKSHPASASNIPVPESKRDIDIPVLNDLVSIEFCSKTTIIVKNNTWFQLQVEIGNLKNNESKKFQLSSEETYSLDAEYDKDTWYLVHYNNILHNLDINRFTKAINSIYQDLNLMEVGTKVTKKMLDILPPNPPIRYDSGQDEYYYDYAAAEMEKEFYKLGVDIFSLFQQEEAKRQIRLFNGLMIQSFYLHNHYLNEQKKGLTPLSFSKLPTFKEKFPKSMSPTFFIKGSIFANLIEEGKYNPSWDTRTQSYRGELHIGLPFEKSAGARNNKEYYRPYLVVGYEQTNIILNPTTAAYVGTDYLTGGEQDQEYALSTREGIKLSTHAFQLGLSYKAMPKDKIYIDLGGGVRKIWKSELKFDDSNTYFSNSNLQFNNSSQKDVLEDSDILPYAQLTIGRTFLSKKEEAGLCQKKLGGLDIFFNGYFSYWNPKPNANYQLYTSTFDNNNPNTPILEPQGSRKWYFYIGMGIGYSFL